VANKNQTRNRTFNVFAKSLTCAKHWSPLHSFLISKQHKAAAAAERSVL
jgi:hypothetical protein